MYKVKQTISFLLVVCILSSIAITAPIYANAKEKTEGPKTTGINDDNVKISVSTNSNFIQSNTLVLRYHKDTNYKGVFILKNKVFEAFDYGELKTPSVTKKFEKIDWSKHPTFEGVELKHIITSADTNGEFSYHLVRIAPNKSIGNHIHERQLETHEVIDGMGICVNDGTEIPYRQGVISIMFAGRPHEVNAGESGLLLLAKFFPALC